MSTGIAVAYGVAIFAVLLVAPMVVTCLKGHWLLFTAGWITVGIVWWIAAARLARPASWWSRRFYGPHKLARAQARYGEVSERPA